MQAPSKRPRWWPAILIALLATAAVAWLQWHFRHDTQWRFLFSTIALVLAAAGLALWLLLLSRLRWRTRLIGLAVPLLLGVLAVALLRVDGLSGNMQPIVRWAWQGSGTVATDVALEERRAADASLASARFPQFLGPTRDGRIQGVRLRSDWESTPPATLWQVPVGTAWSGFAIADGLALTQVQRDGEEGVVALDLLTGATVWERYYEARHDDPFGGTGPRATPTIDPDGNVFAIGATGVLSAWRLLDGEPLWRVETLAGLGKPTYGISGSPLLVDDRVVVSIGGGPGRSLVAYERETGVEVWAAGDAPVGYSSPIVSRFHGARQIMVFNAGTIAAHDPKTGSLLWEIAWEGQTEHVSQPVVLEGDRFFLSTGYGVGGKLFDVPAAGAPTVRWSSRGLKAKFSNVVEVDGYLYGPDDGILACIGVEDGERRWKGGRYGHGQLLRVGNLLLMLTERGDVALVEATPQAFRELARLSVLSGKSWNHPALAGRYLLVRNDREAAALRLPVATDDS